MINFDKATLLSAAKKHNIELVVLYGSQVAGPTTNRSDIDIAIQTKAPLKETKDFLSVLQDLIQIFGEKLDLVLLNEAPPLLAYLVARNGLLLHEEKPGKFNNFKVMAGHRYADTKKFRALNTFFIEGFLKGAIPIAR